MRIVLRFEEHVVSSSFFPHSVFEWEKRAAEGEHPELSNFSPLEEARGDRQHVKVHPSDLERKEVRAGSAKGIAAHLLFGPMYTVSEKKIAARRTGIGMSLSSQATATPIAQSGLGTMYDTVAFRHLPQWQNH